MKNDNIGNKLFSIENKLNLLISQSPLECVAPYSLYAWLDTWLKGYKSPALSKSYMRSLHSAITHIKKVLPDKLLNDYTAPEILTGLYTIPFSCTRSISYDILNNCFFQAVKLGYILSNPLDGTERIRHIRKKGRALTLDEQQLFLQVIDSDPRKALYLFYLLSGVRCSEALGLRWSDIDYHGERIHIQGTKTSRANRYIPLFPQICALLADLPRVGEFVFPFTYYGVKSHFQRLKVNTALTSVCTIYVIRLQLVALKAVFRFLPCQSG